MSLFVCNNCGCIENTALSRYWEGISLCSDCDPAIGGWHGLFPKRKPTDDDEVIDGAI